MKGKLLSTDERTFDCVVEREGDFAILRPVGDIDLTTSPRFRELGTNLVEQGVRRLAIDLGKVPFLDSTALGILVVILKRLRDKHGSMVLFSPREQVRTLLSMTGLDTVLVAETDEPAARARLAC